MKPHLTLAHHRWKEYLKPGDLVIDATMGNGHDTVYLAQLLDGKGKVVGYDIQPEALAETEKRVQALPEHLHKIVELKLRSHTHFEEKNVKLIVYNLGYLPGSDKQITTQCETTLQSLQKGMIISQALSITCYPGHEEGRREEEAIKTFLETIDPQQWHICHYAWLNRPFSPTWLWLQAVPGA